jgi:hypothetical protein
MTPKEDEIDKQSELAQIALEKQAGGLLLILLVLYFGAWLLHWFLGIPSSMNAVNVWSAVIALYFLSSAVKSRVDSFVAEYRLRTKHTADQLAALEARMKAIGEAIEKRL